MAGVIDGLTGGSGSATTQPSSGGSDAANPTLSKLPETAQLAVRGLSSGQIPGAYVPKGANPQSSGLKPDDLFSVGIALYKPHSKDILAVAFNPDTLSEKTLKAMDKAGKIPENLPNLMNLLQGNTATGGGITGADTTSSPTTATPLSGITPKLDGNGSPDAARTSAILPRPAPRSSLLASQRATEEASKEPSKRQVPGAGNVLNGLLARPV